MKRIILITVALISAVQLSAQTNPYTNKPSKDEYDTLVVFNPIANVPNWNSDITYTKLDTAYRTFWCEEIWSKDSSHVVKHIDHHEPDTVIAEYTMHYNYPYRTWMYHNIKTHDYLVDGTTKGTVIGSNSYKVEAFAQPWHLDTASYICGIYVDMSKSEGTDYNTPEYFKLMDTNFNVLTQVYQTASHEGAVIIDGNGDTVLNEGESLHNYYFDKHDIKIKDFILSADISLKSDFAQIFSGHTCSIYDPDNDSLYMANGLSTDKILLGLFPDNIRPMGQFTEVKKISGKQPEHLLPPCPDKSYIVDTIKLYSAEESPWLKKDGQWKRFSEDTVYDIYQKMVLNFLPIILVPKAPKDTVRDTSSLADAMAEANLWIYPNPVNDILTVQSGFTIHQIDIFDISGKRVYSEKTAVNSIDIDASHFTAGTYSVRIETSRGTITRKLIKQS